MRRVVKAERKRVDEETEKETKHKPDASVVSIVRGDFGVLVQNNNVSKAERIAFKAFRTFQRSEKRRETH